VYLDKKGKFLIKHHQEGYTSWQDIRSWSADAQFSGTFEIKDSKIYWKPDSCYENATPWVSDLYGDFITTYRNPFFNNEFYWVTEKVNLQKMKDMSFENH
jgi:hypothetical protein